MLLAAELLASVLVVIPVLTGSADVLDCCDAEMAETSMSGVTVPVTTVDDVGVL